jgi:bifunctional lysine-specific demethylase and histidyl-hydroxylase NO66
VPEQEFVDGYWGARPLFSPAAKGTESFADLFSLEAVDELLSRRGLRTPFIRLAKDGAVVDPSRYTRSGGVGAAVADQVVDDRVLELFADGHTVVLQGLHRLWPPLIDFAGELTAELGHPVQINAYVTPSGSQGFAAHYDVHDVFVLQISGHKRWIVHEPVHVDPLRTQPWHDYRQAVTKRAGEQPELDVVLAPGDTLYLPRGYVHSAEALGEISTHLTVGIQAHTRHTVVEALVELVADDASLRQTLPLGLDIRDPDDLATELGATVDALVARLQSVRAADVARILDQRTRGDTRPAPLRPLAQADALSRLDLDSVISARRHLRVMLDVQADGLALVLPGRTLRLSLAARTAVDGLLGLGLPVRIGDLPGLSDLEALALSRELVRAGVVVLHDSAVSNP